MWNRGLTLSHATELTNKIIIRVLYEDSQVIIKGIIGTKHEFCRLDLNLSLLIYQLCETRSII